MRTRLGFVLVAMCLFWVLGVIKLIEYIHSQWYLFALEAIKLFEYIHSPLNPGGWRAIAGPFRVLCSQSPTLQGPSGPAFSGLDIWRPDAAFAER